MPCDTIRLTPEQTLAQRMEEVRRALEDLKKALQLGTTRVVIGPQGAVSFAGWQGSERKGLTDACAYRTLAVESSWELRQAVARAEALSGRKVNVNAVAAGVHSHDQGATWGKDK